MFGLLSFCRISVNYGGAYIVNHGENSLAQETSRLTLSSGETVERVEVQYAPLSIIQCEFQYSLVLSFRTPAFLCGLHKKRLNSEHNTETTFHVLLLFTDDVIKNFRLTTNVGHVLSTPEVPDSTSDQYISLSGQNLAYMSGNTHTLNAYFPRLSVTFDKCPLM